MVTKQGDINANARALITPTTWTNSGLSSVTMDTKVETREYLETETISVREREESNHDFNRLNFDRPQHVRVGVASAKV
jgi:hypothetical protein